MDHSYRYRAFISYRHLSPDSEIARTLHRQIEQYKIPSPLTRQLGIRTMGKVFRDQDELPTSADLGSDIENALKDSQWLIIICSPELLQSKWCMKEIETFIAMGRRDRILPVLVRGEPSESFPDSIRFVETEGGIIEREPLAADVRAPTLKEMKRKLPVEKLRILAPMLGVGFDDLRQRAKEQRLRNMIAISTAAATLVTAFSIYAVTQNRIIAQQRNRAVENELMLWLEKSSLASSTGDKLGGLVYALRAHDAGTAISHSHQSEIVDALELGLYSEDFQPVSVVKNKGMMMSQMTYSPDGTLIAGIINQNAAAVLDAFSGEILHMIGNNREPLSAVGFSPDSAAVYTYCGWENRVAVWDCTTGLLLGQYVRENDNAWTVGCAGFMDGSQELLLYDHERLFRWDFQRNLVITGSGADSPHISEPIASMNNSGHTAFAASSLDSALWVYSLPRDVWTPLENPGGNTASLVTVSSDGTWVAASLGSNVAVWVAETGEQILQVPVYAGSTVYSLCFHPDTRTLAYADEERIVLLDLETGEPLWVYADPEPNQVYSLTFSQDGHYLLARHIHAVILESHSGIVVHDFGSMEVQGAVFSPDGKTLLFSQYNGTIAGYTTDLGANVHPDTDFQGDLYTIQRFSPIPGDPPSLLSLHSVGPHVSPGLSRLYTSPEGSFAAMTHGDGFIEVWDLSGDGTPVYGISEHTMMIHDLIMTETLLASGSQDGRVMLFDLELGQLRIALSFGSPIRRMEISPDGTKLMVLHDNGFRSTVVSTISGGVLFLMDGHDSLITDMGFAEDGQKAVIRTENGRSWVGEIYTDFEELLEASRTRVLQ